jgi:hypothetical protein
MASQDKNQSSAALLWIIGPVTVLLTLYFTAQGGNTVQNKEVLGGKLPEAKKVEAPMAAPAADSTATAAPADSTAR